MLIIAVTVLLCPIGCKKQSIIEPPPIIDTTSHAISWEVTVLGGNSQGLMRGVAIINDTLAYAVGLVRVWDDSLMWGREIYNLAIWNGHSWRLDRARVFWGTSMATFEGERVFAYSERDIWVLAGGMPLHSYGNEWELVNPRPSTSDSVSTDIAWGTTSFMYFGGILGTLLYYDGVAWQRIATGTLLPFRDIWGDKDPLTGNLQVLALACESGQRRLYSLEGTTARPLDDSGLPTVVNSLWFLPGQKYFIVGSGMYEKTSLNEAAWDTLAWGTTGYQSWSVRGSSPNDVFVAGSFMEVVHWNGASWHDYRDQIPFGDGCIGQIAVRGNLIIMVGYLSGQPVAYVGRRR